MIPLCLQTCPPWIGGEGFYDHVPPSPSLSHSFWELQQFRKILFDFNVEHFRRLPKQETHEIEEPETFLRSALAFRACCLENFYQNANSFKSLTDAFHVCFMSWTSFHRPLPPSSRPISLSSTGGLYGLLKSSWFHFFDDSTCISSALKRSNDHRRRVGGIEGRGEGRVGGRLLYLIDLILGKVFKVCVGYKRFK